MNTPGLRSAPNHKQDISASIAAIDQLPTLDAIVFEVQKRLDDPAADAAKVAAFVERDLGLSAKILKVANSVFFTGRYGSIGNLQQAIARLGIRQTYSLCLVFKTMEMFSSPSNFLNLKEFWAHSISVAQVARLIAQAAQGVHFNQTNAYTAGLFHDIGIFVLDRFLPDMYQTIQEQMDSSRDTRHSIEKRIFSIDHGGIGGLILKRWKFPEDIIAAVSCHHFPKEAPENAATLVQLIHVAEFLCDSVDRTSAVPVLPDISIDSIWFLFNIEEEIIRDIKENVKKEMERSYLFLNLEM